MNFEDEHYVRIYTRHTKTVKRWGWEGRVLFRELTATVDKAGILDDIEDPVQDVALMVELPVEIVKTGLPRLLESGSVEIHEGKLVIPNYVYAQTARKSDAQRAKESRERRSRSAQSPVTNRDGSVTKRDGESRNGTEPNEVEQNRTAGESVTNRDATVTNRDAHAPKRDEPFDPVTSCHPTQINADQRNAEEGSGSSSVAKPRDRESSLALPVADRARLILDEPHKSAWLQPHTWPEVLTLAQTWADALGWHSPRLSASHRAVPRLVEMLAHYSAAELSQAITEARTDGWLNDPTKRLGLSSLSLEVVGRLLSASKGKAEPADMKRAAKIEREREETFERELEHQCELKRKAGWTAEKVSAWKGRHREARRAKLAKAS